MGIIKKHASIIICHFLLNIFCSKALIVSGVREIISNNPKILSPKNGIVMPNKYLSPGII